MDDAIKDRRVGKLLEQLQAAGLDVPVLRDDEPRWRWLQFDPAPDVDLRDRLRGVLIGVVPGTPY